jgi:hypothetical protein
VPEAEGEDEQTEASRDAERVEGEERRVERTCRLERTISSS